MSMALEVHTEFSDARPIGYRSVNVNVPETKCAAAGNSLRIDSSHDSESRFAHKPANHDELFIAELWRQYKQSRSTSALTQLIVHYMGGHVRRVAERLRTQLPKQVDLDDLVQSAYARLVGCIEAFELAKNTRFETYSSPCLAGAMKDYLRELDDLPRLARQRCKHVQQLREDFFKTNGREPSVQELRARLKHLTPRKFRRMLADSRAAAMVPFSAASSARGGAGEAADAMTAFRDEHVINPLSRAEREDLKRWLTTGFARRDRLIIVLYYYEHMTMKDIGATLGCSESRVSQRLEAIKNSLRARLRRIGAEQELLTK